MLNAFNSRFSFSLRTVHWKKKNVEEKCERKVSIEFTIFFSLSKQQLNLVIIIKEYKQWEVPL